MGIFFPGGMPCFIIRKAALFKNIIQITRVLFAYGPKNENFPP
jgi:hypothetical protein